MYRIFADETLIYDSTLDDFKIVKGTISLETNKSGSFTFSIYPDHFYYDKFVKLKTVITVYKSGKIVFRGRILNDVTDHWNNKNITCEGELGFLQDSIIRPFSFKGTPEALFTRLIEEHNSQVDDFKQFNIGTVTVVDPNNRITRSNSEYESSLSNLNSRLIEDSLGGYFYITHGDDGTDPIPTINYLADFTKVSSQVIEFGSNLKQYTKTVKAEELATAIIPLGAEIDDGDDSTDNKKLTIESVNDGEDFLYSEEGVALYGWIFKVVSWDDVKDPATLKTKAEERLKTLVSNNITIELTAIDLHLIDPSIEPFCLNDYIRVISKPHNLDSTLLCTKRTIDLLKPDNDTLTLGYTYSSFTQSTISNQKTVKKSIQNIKSNITETQSKINDVNSNFETTIAQNKESILLKIAGEYSTKEELASYREFVNGELELKLGRDDDDKIISIINAVANQITVTSDNFTLTADGHITTKSGKIGDWTLGEVDIPISSYETITRMALMSEKLEEDDGQGNIAKWQTWLTASSVYVTLDHPNAPGTIYYSVPWYKIANAANIQTMNL